MVSKKSGDYALYDQCIRAKIGPTGKSAKLKCSEKIVFYSITEAPTTFTDKLSVMVPSGHKRADLFYHGAAKTKYGMD